jgi:hypothetical protein
MASVSLAQIDTAFSRPAVAHVVPKLPLQPGGVDPLGLRQLNLDLMDWALPGINNVTVLIRPSGRHRLKCRVAKSAVAC